MKTAIWLTLVTLSWGVTDLDYLKGFDDSVLYKIDWPGPGDGNLGDLTGMESMMVTTHDKEKYTCYFPKMDDLGSSMDKDYDGPTPMDLLMPLFASSPCTIMIDIYWSYELCHGKYIRQFHDAVVSSQGKNGHPQVQTREYFLGYWNSKKTKALLNDLELQKASGHGIDPPIKKIEGIDVPYFQVNYTDGTLCDLTGGFRRSSILYVCILGARSDVFIVKEVTTCEYEIIVTRSELCKHPLYRPKQSAEKDIKCLPAENSPHKPTSLARMEADLARNRIHKEIPLALDGKDENVVATFSIEEYVGEDGHTQFRISLKGLEDGLEDKAKSLIEDLTSKIEPPSAKDFLEGRFCPTGKSRNGEWVYTFCFGKHVRQTHNVDGSDSKTSTLGIWDETAHIMWMKRKAKSPSSQSFSTSYFYGNGDICQETGKPKETEVRLKCTNAEGVSLFILEPRTCQYIVGIESSMICEFINKLDQHGLPKL